LAWFLDPFSFLEIDQFEHSMAAAIVVAISDGCPGFVRFGLEP
jgi:hypothetical protein